ncbi:MAG: PQQ-binding-like beta-propeller repeat protein [Fimbriiglobus sp.]|nr:PQQ-binding-like beta-propeller repeat protein [Fimbriiglobus sp.]
MLPLLLASALAANPGTDSWAGFRNDGSGRTAATNLPVKWSPTELVAWRVETPGYGQSSPVVWKGNVYLTSVEGEQKEKLHVCCFAAADGKKLWAKTFDATQKGKNNPMMSRAAGTPVADAAGVYALFESGDLIALDHAGQVRWQRHFAKEFGELKNNHGLGSSPAQTESAVVVLLDHQGPSKLLAVDKSTGKDAWAVDRTARSSWTSPVVVSGTVVVSSGGTVTGYAAADGKQLWELAGLIGNSIPSAAVTADGVVVAAGENRQKPDADGTSKSNCKITLGGKDGYSVAWRAKKLAAGTASPVVHAGHVYFTDKSGFVICLDEKTGEEKYRERLDNQQWATPIAAGEHVFFFGKDGITTVLKAGDTFEKVASNKVWSDADAAKRKEEAKKKAEATLPKPPEGGRGPGGGPPLPKEELEATRYSAVGDVVYGAAAVDGAFFVRTGTELICIRAK